MAIIPNTASARTVCGPSEAKTLGKSADARVYKRKGSVRSCTRTKTLRLGSATKIIDVKVTGHFALVRGRVSDGQSVRVVNLRTGRTTGKVQRLKRVGRRKLDTKGVAVFEAVSADGKRLIYDSLGAWYATVGRVDEVGLAGWYVGWRVGDRVTVFSRRDADVSISPDGLLLRSGSVRFEVVDEDRLRVRSGSRPFITVSGKATELHGGTPSSGGGWEWLQIVGDRVIVPFVDWLGGRNITVYDLAPGQAREVCPLVTPSFVVTETGKVACGVQTFEGRSILSEGVVLDSGLGVDPASLTRRGDQLVWLNGGVERSAPIPR